jgi:hypothetical protein
VLQKLKRLGSVWCVSSQFVASNFKVALGYSDLFEMRGIVLSSYGYLIVFTVYQILKQMVALETPLKKP